MKTEPEARRLDKWELFRMLAYVPHEAQRRVHESSAHTKVLACGARWGKSRCAVMDLLAFALAPGPSCLAWIASPRFEVVDKLLDLFVAQMSGGLVHRIVEVNRRARRIVVRNLSGNEVRIEGRNTERVPSLLGESLDYMLVDEAGRVRDEAWEGALSQRLVERDGRAFVCGTPRNEGSWFHRLFARGQGEDPTVESWTGPTVDNPAIDPALVERERDRLSTAEFASEYLGQFVGPDGPLCLTCGGPHRGCRSSVILPLGEVLAHCDACGRPLGRDGQPLGVPTPRGLYVLTLTTDDVKPPEEG